MGAQLRVLKPLESTLLLSRQREGARRDIAHATPIGSDEKPAWILDHAQRETLPNNEDATLRNEHPWGWTWQQITKVGERRSRRSRRIILSASASNENGNIGSLFVDLLILYTFGCYCYNRTYSIRYVCLLLPLYFISSPSPTWSLFRVTPQSAAQVTCSTALINQTCRALLCRADPTNHSARLISRRRPLHGPRPPYVASI